MHGIESSAKSAYESENEALLAKTRMLVSSRSLCFVIEHRDRVGYGFTIGNRDAPGVHLMPKGIEFTGPFGAVGMTGRRYYFVPVSIRSHDKNTIDVYDAPDGIGGVGSIGEATGGWIRFRGKDGGILTNFIRAHRKHADAAEELDAIEQDQKAHGETLGF